METVEKVGNVRAAVLHKRKFGENLHASAEIGVAGWSGLHAPEYPSHV